MYYKGTLKKINPAPTQEYVDNMKIVLFDTQVSKGEDIRTYLKDGEVNSMIIENRLVVTNTTTSTSFPVEFIKEFENKKVSFNIDTKNNFISGSSEKAFTVKG